jgi:very-short-patch-repair endonuclease
MAENFLLLYNPARRGTVELDGGQHNQGDNRECDKARSEYLRAQGIDVMRF